MTERRLHKLMKVAEQPGGLKTMTDGELLVWLDDRRAGLAAAEANKRGGKARRMWRESVDAAEAELARRRGT